MRDDHAGQLAELLDDAGFDDVRVATQSMPTRHVMIGSSRDAGQDHDRPV